MNHYKQDVKELMDYFDTLISFNVQHMKADSLEKRRLYHIAWDNACPIVSKEMLKRIVNANIELEKVKGFWSYIWVRIKIQPVMRHVFR